MRRWSQDREPLNETVMAGAGAPAVFSKRHYRGRSSLQLYVAMDWVYKNGRQGQGEFRRSLKRKPLGGCNAINLTFLLKRIDFSREAREDTTEKKPFMSVKA